MIGGLLLLLLVVVVVVVVVVVGDCLLACLTSQQRASVSQGRICSNNCHAETEAAYQTFCVT